MFYLYFIITLKAAYKMTILFLYQIICIVFVLLLMD